MPPGLEGESLQNEVVAYTTQGFIPWCCKFLMRS